MRGPQHGTIASARPDAPKISPEIGCRDFTQVLLTGILRGPARISSVTAAYSSVRSAWSAPNQRCTGAYQEAAMSKFTGCTTG